MSDRQDCATEEDLRQQLAELRAEVASLKSQRHDSIQLDIPQPVTSTTSGEILKPIHTLDGKYSFNKPFKPADDHVFNESALSPVNPNQQYQAPTLCLSWLQVPEAYQMFDKSLAKIQEQQAHTSGPLDEFAIEVLAHLPDSTVRQSIARSLHIVRSQLSVTARQIQEMRLDNYDFAKGFKPVSGSENRISTAENDLVPRNKEPAANSRVAVQVGRDFSSPSMGMISINPLQIPEIRAEIILYLENGSLAACAAVCKDWNQTFSRLLYSKIEIRRREHFNPSPEALHHNRHLLTSFSILSIQVDSSYTYLILPNLKSLRLDFCDDRNMDMDYGITPATSGLAIMIQNNRSITKLNLSCITTPDNSLFWKSISYLPHLKDLSISTQSVFERRSFIYFDDQTQEIMAFWDACSRVKRLTIKNVCFKHDDQRYQGDRYATSMEETLSNKSFPLVQSLNISNNMPIWSQVMLIRLFPSLESLGWWPESTCMEEPDLDVAFTVLCRHFRLGNVPNLKALKLWLPPCGDDIPTVDIYLAQVLRSLSNKPLEELTVRRTEFNERAFDALRPHFQALRVLNFRECPHMTSSMALEVLARCPRLESLVANQIYAWDLDLQQVWPCHKTLQTLNVEFQLEQSLQDSESPSEASTQQELNETVFSCLGQLRELRHLNLCNFILDNPTSISLEIQLSKGLAELSGLKKLMYFNTPRLSSSLGAEEVDWMLANWPSLKTLAAPPPIPRQDILKQRGILLMRNFDEGYF